jgi:hypothetical protein
VAVDSIVFSFIAVVVAGDVVVLAVSVAAVPKRVPSVRPAFGVLITFIAIGAFGLVGIRGGRECRY